MSSVAFHPLMVGLSTSPSGILYQFGNFSLPQLVTRQGGMNNVSHLSFPFAPVVPLKDDDKLEMKSRKGGTVFNVEWDNIDETVVKKETLSDVLSQIPEQITFEELSLHRKVLDVRRWMCISRPQYKYSCGASSLTGCWNYLFSTLGHGQLPPLTQEELLSVLGFQPPFAEIRFGPFTGNQTIMKWFQKLCKHFNVKGKACYFWKAHGKGRTIGVTADMAREELKKELQSQNSAFIYHCHNHYMCPIGYEITPEMQIDAYRSEVDEENGTMFLYIGDSSKTAPAMHCVKWDLVAQDINLQSPYHFNMYFYLVLHSCSSSHDFESRHPEKGVEKRKKAKRIGGNLHCIMQFKKCQEDETFSWGNVDEEEMDSEGSSSE